jgi:hypothetical protein
MSIPILTICHITHDTQLLPYRKGLRELLGLFRNTLLPKPHAILNDSEILDLLLENTTSCIPLLWLITNQQQQVYGASVLMDIVPNQHAYVHGITHPAIRKHPMITQLAILMFRTAFMDYELSSVKAEFDQDNKGALGFCRRMGFQKQEECHVLTKERFLILMQNHLNQPHLEEGATLCPLEVKRAVHPK